MEMGFVMGFGRFGDKDGMERVGSGFGYGMKMRWLVFGDGECLEIISRYWRGFVDEIERV